MCPSWKVEVVLRGQNTYSFLPNTEASSGAAWHAVQVASILLERFDVFITPCSSTSRYHFRRHQIQRFGASDVFVCMREDLDGRM
jgi:hypothetical protein